MCVFLFLKIKQRTNTEQNIYMPSPKRKSTRYECSLSACVTGWERVRVRFMHRLLRTCVLVACLAVALTASAEAFRDTPRHEYGPQVEVLRERGIVRGYPDGRFRPDHTITRAEFLKILTLAVTGGAEEGPGEEVCFTDFRGPPQWYWGIACRAKERGIISGYADGTFRGGKPVTTAEALKMSVRGWQLPLPISVEPPRHWYDPYYVVAEKQGVFVAIPHYAGHLLTRGETAALFVALGGNIASVSLPAGSSPSLSESSLSPVAPEAKGDESSASSPRIRCPDGRVTSGACEGYKDPVARGVIRIEQVSSGSGETTVGGDNMPLVAFDIVAGNQDALLTSLTFRRIRGDLGATNRFRLVLPDGNRNRELDLVLGDGVVQGDTLLFRDLSVRLAQGMPQRMEVRADVRPVNTEGVLAIGFATDLPDYVQAHGTVDHRDITGIQTNGAPCTVVCRITVTTAPERSLTVRSLGSLFVTQNAQTVPSRQILLGTRSDPLLRLTFRAAAEDVLVTSLQIGGGTESISALELTRDGGTQPFAIARVSQCSPLLSGVFCALASDGILRVPRDQEIVVIIRALLKADTEGGRSGDTVSLTLTSATDGPAVLARGASSQKTLAQNNGDTVNDGEVFIGLAVPGGNIPVVGPVHDAVAAKILSVSKNSVDADGASVPAGMATVGQFRFAAAAHRNTSQGTKRVALTKLVFTVSAVNVSFLSDSFVLYNTADSSRQAACQESSTTGQILVTCSNLGTGAVPFTIDPGGSIDVALRGQLTAGSTGTRLLQATLGNVGDRANPGTIEWEDGVYPFQWVDIGESQVRGTLYRN
ncbi:MAG: putative surface layer protein [Candidatus Peregrinibacteria bacterium Greene0416_19]|nr:MAG: putative surface layer protein [Candidatus Peregrinibacteria bacterium Greene0416_19]